MRPSALGRSALIESNNYLFHGFSDRDQRSLSVTLYFVFALPNDVVMPIGSFGPRRNTGSPYRYELERVFHD